LRSNIDHGLSASLLASDFALQDTTRQDDLTRRNVKDSKQLASREMEYHFPNASKTFPVWGHTKTARNGLHSLLIRRLTNHFSFCLLWIWSL